MQRLRARSPPGCGGRWGSLCGVSVTSSAAARRLRRCPREPPGWTHLAGTWQGRRCVFSFTRRSPATSHGGCARLCQQRGARPGASAAPVQGDVQDGQPAGPAPASPCGFIFMFMMVNGIEPFSINFSGHLD